MGNNVMVNIVSEERYLAIGKNGRHATLTREQFANLGAIFTLDSKMVQHECKMSF